MNRFDLTGKKALVTGSSRGIGRALAEALLEAGADVVINGVSKHVFRTAEELAAHQARTIDELSSELANQWALVDQLQKKLDRMVDRFAALEQASLEAPAVTPPPHY